MKMEKRTHSERFEEYIINEVEPKHHPLGLMQTVYRFPNNYGASVIEGELTYGLELAVLVFDDERQEGGITYNRPITDDHKGYITYDTPITDDVVGYIDDLDEYLELIWELEQ